MMHILDESEPRSTQEFFSSAVLAVLRCSHTVIEWQGENHETLYPSICHKPRF